MGEIIPFRNENWRQNIIDDICNDLHNGVDVFGFLAEVHERSEIEFRNKMPEYFDNMPSELKKRCQYIVREALKYADNCASIIKEHDDYVRRSDFNDSVDRLYRITSDFGELHLLERVDEVEAVEEYIPEEGDGLKLICEIREFIRGILNVISQDIITNEWINYDGQLVIHMSVFLRTLENEEEQG